jgi:hypothetical protein
MIFLTVDLIVGSDIWIDDNSRKKVFLTISNLTWDVGPLQAILDIKLIYIQPSNCLKISILFKLLLMAMAAISNVFSPV